MIQTSPLQRLGRALYNTFLAMSGAYGLSVLGFLLLRQLAGESWWIIAVMNSFAHLLFAPALILIPLMLLLRQFRMIVLLLPPLAAFILTYGELFTQRVVALPADSQPITLLTYNISPQQVNLGPMTENIRQANADIVTIQELSEPAAAYLDAELAELYPYRAFHPQPGQPIPGQGILSRYPITSDDYWQINLGHQRVTLEIGGQEVTLYNVHPIHPFVARSGFEMRTDEVNVFLERAAQDTGPLLLVGDFNLSDQSEDYGRIRAGGYSDLYRSVGWGMGFTFPDLKANNPQMAIVNLIPDFLLPIARIDYVFYNESFTGLAAQVLPESGHSDHRPLYATLALNPPAIE